MKDADKIGGDEKQAKNRCGKHSSDNPDADSVLGFGTWAAADGQGENTKTEGERSHQHGPHTLAQGMDGCGNEVFTLIVFFLGKFHDQNGIFGRKADNSNKSHLEIDVVGQIEQAACRQYAE